MQFISLFVYEFICEEDLKLEAGSWKEESGEK
jgi:hypothetical protein